MRPDCHTHTLRAESITTKENSAVKGNKSLNFTLTLALQLAYID